MPAESYDDDEDEIEGPKSSFGTYLAEGDTLFKQSEFKKALESYSLVSKTCYLFTRHLFGFVFWILSCHLSSNRNVRLRNPSCCTLKFRDLNA